MVPKALAASAGEKSATSALFSTAGAWPARRARR